MINCGSTDNSLAINVVRTVGNQMLMLSISEFTFQTIRDSWTRRIIFSSNPYYSVGVTSQPSFGVRQGLEAEAASAYEDLGSPLRQLKNGRHVIFQRQSLPTLTTFIPRMKPFPTSMGAYQSAIHSILH
jgi:hypothetical protein